MSWTTLAESYLVQQRQLGYSLTNMEHYLLSFASFVEQQGNKSILTIELAFEWAKQAPSGSDIAIACRFCVLRPFFRYLAIQGYDVEVLPTHFAGPTHRRLPPYIFSDAEVTLLMDEADKLKSSKGLRPMTIKTLIGLLASTGIRPGEAVRLKCQDVDLTEGQLIIHNSKGWTQRVIPLSVSAVDALQSYRTCRMQVNPLGPTGFFLSLIMTSRLI